MQVPGSRGYGKYILGGALSAGLLAQGYFCFEMVSKASRHRKEIQEVVEDPTNPEKYPFQTEEDTKNHLKTTGFGAVLAFQCSKEYLEKALRDKGINVASVKKVYPEDKESTVFVIEFKYPENEDESSHKKQLEKILYEVSWEFSEESK